MKYDVSEVVLGFDGKPFEVPKEGTEQDKIPAKVWLTIGKLIVQAIMALIEGKQIPGEEKFKRYKLAEKIYDKKEVELSLEEANLIKQSAGEALQTMFAGKVWDFLEKPKAEEKPEEKAK